MPKILLGKWGRNFGRKRVENLFLQKKLGLGNLLNFKNMMK